MLTPSKLRHAGLLAMMALTGWLLAGSPSPAMAKDISVAVDQAKLVRLSRPGAEVVIGNPSIADVSVQNARVLVVTGKTFGTTNLIVLDAKGREILNEKVRVHTEHKRQVSLYKGSSRVSYDCDGRCQSALVPGDDPLHVDALAKAIISKFGIAQSALDGEISGR
ncbi:MAG: pilus assembly protein N-terminal domain-containing protein [Methyloligellaceae bacterium]